ncbi:MAG: PSD1 and planctomycete cytochrome C domain-containing protein [Kiritimatiellae bacterium]|nr:PSD1 and planctomycete cytochrome C domain-containing protein [Kiritimatiellia bacterium]
MMVLIGLLACFPGPMYRFGPVFVLIDMKKTFYWAFALFCPLFLAGTTLAVDTNGPAFFDQQVFPILEKRCYACHGAEKISSGLVLTHRDGLVAGGKRGSAIDADNPATSRLLAMINHTDLTLRMPYEKPPLNDADKKVLHDWVMMGAPYHPEREYKPTVQSGGAIDAKARDYWAYQPPRKADPPTAPDDWARSAIDAFVLQGLKGAGLTPSPQADARALLRRVYYDLIGLSPTASELSAFEKGSQSDVEWGRVVDQLLSSPRFGEKLASLWLDVVRYAETNGYEHDNLKPFIWRYRDYVIRAFNEDKPYDRFVIEQLAGDQLQDKSFETVIATGYLSLMLRDHEPADRLQAHHDMIGDIVNVTGEAMMGTTMGCAKCHDHKGDPIRQEDYFSMKAFFDGIKKSKLTSARDTWIPPNASEDTSNRKVDLDKVISKMWGNVDTARLGTLMPVVADPKPLIPFGETAPSTWQVANHLPDDLDWARPDYRGDDFLPLSTPLRDTPERLGNAFFDPAHAEHWVLRRDFGLTDLPGHLHLYVDAYRIRGLTVYVNGVATFEGLPERSGAYYYVPFSPEAIAALQTGRNTIGILIERHGASPRVLDVGLFHDPIFGMSFGALAEVYPVEVGKVAGAAFVEEMVSLIKERRVMPERQRGGKYMGASEHASILPSHVHLRGNVNSEGKAVPVAFPVVMCADDASAVFMPLRENNREKVATQGRRLAFAQWLTQPDHPLTARVMVNRLWQQCFGVGLVSSANDFGVFGKSPSNQALLDWLAVEFVESGWRIKHLLRLMVTSATYRQSTLPREDALGVDALNRLHWRHSPRRLSAEEIRDTFLALTGELNLAGGGPPVRPLMPAAVLATASRPHKAWPQTQGPEANRRTVYVHVKRSIQLPMLSSFDAPERDASCAARFATTVPTQALTMLNSAFVNTCAEKFAQRVAADAASLNERIDAAFMLAMGRDATESERDELRGLDETLQSAYGLGENERLSRLCLIVLNLNETIYLD